METTIKINCEDKRELLMHLDNIKESLQHFFHSDIDDGFELEDSNCYGTHTLIIKE